MVTKNADLSALLLHPRPHTISRYIECQYKRVESDAKSKRIGMWAKSRLTRLPDMWVLERTCPVTRQIVTQVCISQGDSASVAV
jgi:hypothetical protein